MTIVAVDKMAVTIDVWDTHAMLDCLFQWRAAAWAGDAYKYCEASDERDRILDKLLGEGTAPSESETINNQGDK